MQVKDKVPFGPIGMIVALGIVFGDIGTSPLYVMRAILNGLPAGLQTVPEYVIGTVSCIFWTLTIQTTFKYIIITLRADNKGEGGILSLYALIRKKYRWAYIIAAIGAAALLADGVITPAMTVISAIEGLHVIVPSIPVIPVTVAIVAVVFLVQSLGTGSLGRTFGVMMLLWFGMMAATGANQLAGDLSVLKAINPAYAIRFIAQTPNALIILGAIFLCTTGAEALYSDLGHCGLKNIRMSWIFVKTALVINYMGQAAWVINNPGMIVRDVNPFFMMMPGWFHLTGVILATMAAIIASQALISGSYTIISEAISLNLWPNMTIKYPTKVKGQMYVPTINFVLMAICILIIVTMRSSMNLEAAYGLAISISMLMTSVLLLLYLLKNKKPLYVAIPLITFFVLIELGFLTANMLKFTHGGFIPIMIMTIVVLGMYVWYNGRRIKRKLTSYEMLDDAYALRIMKISEDVTIPKFATHLVYLIKAKRKNNIESKITYSLFSKTPKRADTYWFIHIVRTDAPYEFSYETTVLTPGRIFRVDVKAGFKLGIHVDKYVGLITRHLELEGKVDLSSRYPSMEDSGYKGDFTFMVVDRITINTENLDFRRRLILKFYDAIRRLTTSDVQMYDIDPSIAVVEKIPLQTGSYTEAELYGMMSRQE